MPTIHEILTLPNWKKGEKIVGLVSHCGRLFAITELGTLYMIDLPI